MKDGERTLTSAPAKQSPTYKHRVFTLNPAGESHSFDDEAEHLSSEVIWMNRSDGGQRVEALVIGARQREGRDKQSPYSDASIEFGIVPQFLDGLLLDWAGFAFDDPQSLAVSEYAVELLSQVLPMRWLLSATHDVILSGAQQPAVVGAIRP